MAFAGFVKQLERWWLVEAGAVVAIALAAALIVWGGRPADAPMPRDAAVAADFVRARDLWGSRQPRDLVEAIRLYDGVIRRQPDFAPAHAGLAEAWLVLREYGAADDATAYPRAERAAKRAMALDPDIPGPYRAAGFIAYWWRNDADGALRAFRRAVQLDDKDAQSHFWYANVLADVGLDAEAQRQYDRARLLQPGSQPIAVEQACSHWQAGRDARAFRDLTALAARYPTDATVHNCLAWLHMSHGDIRAYAREYRITARLRGHATFLATADRLDAAIARDPGTAHRVITASLLKELADGARSSHDVPAFYAASMGDRDELLALLATGIRRREVWYSRAITDRIARRWRGDATVMRALRQVQGPMPAA